MIFLKKMMFFVSFFYGNRSIKYSFYLMTSFFSFFMANSFSDFFISIFSIIYFEIMTYSYLNKSIPPANWMAPHVPEESKDLIDFGFGFFFYLMHAFISFGVYYSCVFDGYF